MSKIYAFILVFAVIVLFMTACSASIDKGQETDPDFSTAEESVFSSNEEHTDSPDFIPIVANKLPSTFVDIPSEYTSNVKRHGTLVDLYYDTYESMSYEQRSKTITKRAVVYLPYDYSESEKYNIFYLMHGGWSNETAYLGTPENPSRFKRVIDNAIQDGVIQPMIFVCPTYNNESPSDSGDYSLALRLTRNYHNELIGDLIPAVEGKYSTYAEGTSKEELIASRDHRAFGGFSMGSVATWRTFEYCLDYFRYFLPASGAISSDIDYLTSIVKNSGRSWNDFFILTASGTEDFAYSEFKRQVDVMKNDGDIFRFADNEADGNLYYLELEGGVHNYDYAQMYLYNCLGWLWSDYREPMENTAVNKENFTSVSTVSDVINDSAFGDFGRLLFPVDRSVSDSMTLGELSTSGVFIWYNNIKTDKTVEILNYLKAQSETGKQIFYNIYSEEEMNRDVSKRDTGLFFFRGNEGAGFAVMNAGGGFMYVGAMHDSFPHALEASKNGYNAFALIYRPDAPYSDLARAIEFIHDNADTLGVDPDNYSLWGGSAGARMAAELGNYDRLKSLTGRMDIPQAAAVIMQYTGYTSASKADAPIYACVGTNDGIANWRTMQAHLETLSSYGIPTEFHAYDGLPHGFGLGTGTAADGWFDEALKFWKAQMK